MAVMSSVESALSALRAAVQIRAHDGDIRLELRAYRQGARVDLS
jgi:hypothetical protein